MSAGLMNANCIRVFYEIEKMVRSRGYYYMANYGLIPEYKAGVHGGDVIRAEIGDLKRDLIYNGDVLNTTARIQAECNRFNARLLIARTLFEKLVLPPGIMSEDLGKVMLKGKRHPVDLVRLYQKSEIPHGKFADKTI
jgi:adenylate cyclase